MARVTVEDCVQKIPNRFELVMMAAHRARELASGATLTIERDNDKNPVVALREIADETVVLDALRDGLIKGHQKMVESDEPEPTDEIAELMAGEQAWGAQTADEAEVDAGGFGEDDPVGDDELVGAAGDDFGDLE